MSSTADPAGLEAPHLPTPDKQSPWWRWGVVAGAVALLVGWSVWYVTTPEALPTDDETVDATGVVGTPLYVGMFAAPDGFDRGIHISGVKTTATASAKVSITPMLCRQGTVGVTTDPKEFCASLENPEGQRLLAGDSIVLRVQSDDAALAKVEQIRIGFQEGLRWGTEPAGHKGATVALVARDAD